MNVLAVDIGGTHIKLRTERHAEIVKFDSGKRMTPSIMMSQIDGIVRDWKFDRVSLGFPGPISKNRPTKEPHNLGSGWTTFEFESSFHGKPVRMINDAAMQALGSYRGGTMLFLGLGTGLGSALVCNGIVQGMELAHLPWKRKRSYEEFVGLSAYKRMGRKRWTKHVLRMIKTLHAALAVDYVVLGGGNARLLAKLPSHVAVGGNQSAFKGAFMLWRKPPGLSCKPTPF